MESADAITNVIHAAAVVVAIGELSIQAQQPGRGSLSRSLTTAACFEGIIGQKFAALTWDPVPGVKLKPPVVQDDPRSAGCTAEISG